MEIIKQQIIVSITKTELNSLIAEAMANPDSASAIKRVLNPLLVDSFPQFSEFTQISLGDTDEAGTTQVILNYGRDLRVENGFKEDNRINLRLMKVF